MTLAKSLESVDSFIWDRSTKPSSDSMKRASPISPVFTSETFISSALGTSMVEGTSAANTDIPRQLAHRVQAKAATTVLRDFLLEFNMVKILLSSLFLVETNAIPDTLFGLRNTVV